MMNIFNTTDLKIKVQPPEEWTKGIELCNRTSCQSGRNVAYYNQATQAYYCPSCAKLINNTNASIDNDKLKYEKDFKYRMTWKEFQNTRDIFFQ